MIPLQTRYELIKEYPGCSLKKGNVVIKVATDDVHRMELINPNLRPQCVQGMYVSMDNPTEKARIVQEDVENYPEFWVKMSLYVVVLSVRYTDKNKTGYTELGVMKNGKLITGTNTSSYQFWWEFVEKGAEVFSIYLPKRNITIKVGDTIFTPGNFIAERELNGIRFLPYNVFILKTAHGTLNPDEVQNPLIAEYPLMPNECVDGMENAFKAIDDAINYIKTNMYKARAFKAEKP